MTFVYRPNKMIIYNTNNNNPCFTCIVKKLNNILNNDFTIDTIQFIIIL